MRMRHVRMRQFDRVALRPGPEILGLFRDALGFTAQRFAPSRGRVQAQREICRGAERYRQPEVHQPVADDTENGGAVRCTEADERRGEHRLDDSESSRRHRNRSEHVGQAVGHEEAVDPGAVAESEQEHP